MKFTDALRVVRSLCHNDSIGGLLCDLSSKQAKWSQETFGDDSDRGPVGPLKHLKDEVDEAIAATGIENNPDDSLEEFADIFLLAIESARRSGFTLHELAMASTAKQIVNMSRKWPAIGSQNLDSPVCHIKEE